MSSTQGGQIDIERTYTVPQNDIEANEAKSSGLCCCRRREAEDNQQEEGKKPVKGLIGTRWSTLVMILLWTGGIILSSIKLGWTEVECDLNHDDDSFVDSCITNSTIYRITSVVIVLLAFQAIFSMCVMSVYDSYWLLKLLYLGGASAGLLVPAADFFDDQAFIFISRIGGLIFIIFLQTILLDFAYYWKKSWVDHSTASGQLTNASMRDSDLMLVMKNIWMCALLVVSIVYVVIFIVASSIMLKYFGGAGCADNQSIIVISMVLVIGALVFQLCLSSNGSIIASGILAVYVAYVTYAAVSLNPDADCNPTLSNEAVYGVGPQVIGLVLAFLSILWASVMTTRRMAHVLGAGGATGSGMLNVGSGSHSGTRTNSTEEALKGSLRVTVMNLNIVFISLSFYLAMILTNWGTIAVNDDSSSPNGGSVSMWMQAVGGWIAVGFYIVGLILPKFRLLPRSIWDLQPKF